MRRPPHTEAVRTAVIDDMRTTRRVEQALFAALAISALWVCLRATIG